MSYTYPGAETPALRNINLIIRPGERLAIVGRNGAGKTTLVKMLCGLYRPGEGQVLAGGADVAQFNRDAYCRFCHKIAVLQAGALAQIGTHEALLAAADGPYARLWNAQAQYYAYSREE